MPMNDTLTEISDDSFCRVAKEWTESAMGSPYVEKVEMSSEFNTDSYEEQDKLTSLE